MCIVSHWVHNEIIIEVEGSKSIVIVNNYKVAEECIFEIRVY